MWKDLSAKEKGDIIRMAINNGITNLGSIRRGYNKYAEGGVTDDKELIPDNTRVYKQQEIEPVKASNETLIAQGYRILKDEDGSMKFLPPLATGKATPVYPEFELLAGGLADIVGTLKLGKQGIKNLLKSTPSKITSKNAHKISDDLWDKFYYKALEEGNMDEVTRLRDLHFKAKTPDNKYPTKVYSTTKDEFPSNFTEYKPEIRGSHAVYTTNNKEMSKSYARGNDRTKELYIYSQNPVEFNKGKYWNSIVFERRDVPNDVYDRITWTGNSGATTRDIEKGLAGSNYDSFIVKDIYDYGPNRVPLTWEPGDVIATFKPQNVKLANPITYDDTGKIIPLSKRDNFNSKDIRYGIIPAIAGYEYSSYRNMKRE